MIHKIYRALKALKQYCQLVAFYYSLDKDIKKYLKTSPQPELTPEEKREIDSYWKQYGIRFRNYDWFQWYYGFTGIRSPKFIPKQIHVKMILAYYNNRAGNAFRCAYSDKNLLYDFFPDVNFPDPILKNIDGDFFDKFNRYVCGGDSLTDLLMSVQGDVIVKRSIIAYQGVGVKKYRIANKQDAQRLLDDWKAESNYIVQKVVKQHPFFARFNESSVNIMRINSIYINGKVEIHTPILRFGYPGWITDVSFIDGLEDVRVVGITDDGYLMDEVVSLQGKRWKLSDVVKDPENKKIPFWDDVVALVKENAPKLKHVGRIGWDITISDSGEPVVIEYNLGLPGSFLSQIAAGPFFGEHTDVVLEFLKDENNQKKYIPHWMRI